MSIWETLSRIDCSQHIEKKGQFSYLSWSWCWSIVKEHYPAASWHLEPEVIFPDGTVEVRITVSIEDQTATMWLPVMDFKNNAKPKPTARDVSDTRMRCLVKCVAVGFGLGHYIYAGESMPQEPPRETYSPEQRLLFIDLLASKDGWGLKKFGQDVGNDIMSDLFSSFQKGQVSKTKSLVRELVGQANQGLKDGLEALEHYIINGSPSAAQEVLAEMTDVERDFVIAGLTEVQKHQLTEMEVEL
jgi:hypothetical protein